MDHSDDVDVLIHCAHGLRHPGIPAPRDRLIYPTTSLVGRRLRQIEQQKLRTAIAGDGDGRFSHPVSYTHLDVYKRQ